MPEKFWQVLFPCLACNVKPRKKRATIAEDCKRRFFFLAFRCYTNTCSLFFRRGFLIGFVLFSSLSSTNLLYCCIPLVMSGLNAVMAAESTMTLEFRPKRHPPSSSNGFPASPEETPSGLTVYPGSFLWCRLASPTAPPFAFNIAFHCSYAWS